MPLRALADLAETACWPLPEKVIAVALARAGSAAAGAPRRSRLMTMSSPASTIRSRTCCSPRDSGALRWEALQPGLGGRRAAIGLAVPLADAADSLRWARQALALAESGTIEAGPVVYCEDHLVTLWLLSDSALADQVSRRHFGALEGLTPRQQERLTETFGAWLETRGTAAEIADRLQVHPQTVRYRIRQLERTLGDQFGDPDARFAMEMVLRVMRLREKKFLGGAEPGALAGTG